MRLAASPSGRRSAVAVSCPIFAAICRLLRRIAWIALPAGLLFGFVIRLLYTGGWEPLGENEGLEAFAQMLRSPAALAACGRLLRRHRRRVPQAVGQAAVRPVRPGRPNGADQLSRAGLHLRLRSLSAPRSASALPAGSASSRSLLICIAFFAFQVAFSHWWLARYRFGPMEWLWRTLTYGERPPMRRAVPQPA